MLCRPHKQATYFLAKKPLLHEAAFLLTAYKAVCFFERAGSLFWIMQMANFSGGKTPHGNKESGKKSGRETAPYGKEKAE